MACCAGWAWRPLPLGPLADARSTEAPLHNGCVIAPRSLSAQAPKTHEDLPAGPRQSPGSGAPGTASTRSAGESVAADAARPRGLARRGHEVSMVTADYGQTDAASLGRHPRLQGPIGPKAGPAAAALRASAMERFCGQALARARCASCITPVGAGMQGRVAWRCSARRHGQAFRIPLWRAMRTVTPRNCSSATRRDRLALRPTGCTRAAAILVQSAAPGPVSLGAPLRASPAAVAGMLVEAGGASDRETRYRRSVGRKTSGVLKRTGPRCVALRRPTARG